MKHATFVKEGDYADGMGEHFELKIMVENRGVKMVSEHKKYVMQVQSKADRKQSRLGTDGKLKMSTAQMVTQQREIDFTQQVMCPFCLHADKLQAFLLSTSKGISQSRAQCPECKNGMMIKSLTVEWAPEQYADWVYDYTGSGYWQKCKFATWKERLFKIGWAKRFWDRYKALKGTGEESEGYIDYINRQGEEYAKQWQEEEQQQ